MKYKTEIGTIGHVDHGKTTLSAAIIYANQETKHELQKVVVDENKGIDSTPEPFIIKNYRADYEVNQTNYLTKKQMRNQRRKQNRNKK